MLGRAARRSKKHVASYDAAPRIVQPLADLLPRVTAPQALIVTESSKRNPLVLDLPLSDERTYGDTRIAVHHGR